MVKCYRCGSIATTVPPNLAGRSLRVRGRPNTYVAVAYCQKCDRLGVRSPNLGITYFVSVNQVVPLGVGKFAGKLYTVGTGSKPFKVIGYNPANDTVDVEYVKSGTMARWGAQRLREYKEATINLNEKEEDMKTLYEIKNGKETLFGHRLAVNSVGDWVMEIKGTGTVHVAKKEDVSEVMPYTVDVKYLGSDQTYAFFAKEGDFAEGDVVFCPDYTTPMFVVCVNTKAKRATKWLHGTKTRGECVAKGDSE